SRTAWRVEGTLREFPKFPPVQVWFDYPRHRVDDRGILKDLESESAAPAWKKASGKAKVKAKEKSVNEKQKFEDAVNNCNMGEPPTLKNLVQWYSDSGKEVTERTIRNWVKKFGFSIDKNNGTVVKSF
ncbi:MAG: DNA primase, partial [Firmicutes bacterium]|nr:DNA primase [Bacillota bacterium]